MMVEMITPAPMAFGPGGAPDNGHGYSAARQLSGMMKTLEKTGDVSAVARSAAADLATFGQEFFQMETVIPYGYHVRSDGKWVNEGKTLEDISGDGAGEGKVQRVIEVQNRMTQDKNITQAVVASEDFGSGRNYVYLFQKKEDAISAYAIEYQGTAGEFKSLLAGLSNKTEKSEKNQEVSFDTPLFFNQKSQMQVQDVFDAALHSYENPGRQQEMQPFLARLARDTDDLPSLIKRQKTHIEEYTQKFKDEMLAQADVVAGLSAACHAMNTIAEQWITADTKLYEERLGMKEQNRILPHYVVSSTETVSSRSPTSISVSTQKNEDGEKKQFQTHPDSLRETRTHYVQETLEPFVPGLITIFYLLSHGGVVSDTSETKEKNGLISQPILVSEDSLSLGSILFSESDTTFDGGVTQEVHSLEAVSEEQEGVELLQDFLVLLFSPETQDTTGEDIHEQNDLIERGEVNIFFSDVVEPASPAGRQEQVYEAVQSIFAELSIVLGDTEGGGERIPQEIETEIVDTAKDILALLLSEKNLLEDEQGEESGTFPESGIYLSLFLSLYTDKKTTPEMKEILALFLYQEIELLGKEHISLSENIPYLTFMKEMSLYKPILEKRKAVLAEKLLQLLSQEMQKNHNLPSSQETVRTLLFLLYALHKNEPEKISSLIVIVEQLKKSVSGKEREDVMDGYLFQLERLLVSKQKKPSSAKASEGKAGIIYWFWQNEYYRLIGLSLPVVNRWGK